MISGDRGEPLQFVLRGPNLDTVAELSTQLIKRLEQISEIGSLDTNLQLDMPELVFVPDREKAREASVDALTISQAIRVLGGGMDVAKYNDDPGDGERYDIRLKAGDGSINSLNNIKNK